MSGCSVDIYISSFLRGVGGIRGGGSRGGEERDRCKWRELIFDKKEAERVRGYEYIHIYLAR